MAKFTASVPLSIRWFGNDIQGAAGATHRIPDALYDEFNAAYNGVIPGLTWVTQDETSAIGTFLTSPIGQTDVTGLTAALAGKLSTSGGTVAGALTVTSTLTVGGAVTFSSTLDALKVSGVVIADRYSSLQAAIDATPASGTLFIPPGAYSISTALVLPSNITIEGAGMGSRLTATGTISIFRGSSVSNVALRNLYIDGGQSTQGGASDADGIIFYDGVNCLVEQCYVTRTARDGIAFRGSTSVGCAAIHNVVVATREDGITVGGGGGGGSDHRIIGNLVSSVWGDGVLLKGVLRTVVQGNTFVSPGTGGNGAGISVGADTATGNAYLSIIGNTVMSAVGASIYCAYTSYSSFVGNTLRSGASYGIWYTNSNDVTFQGNVIDGMAASGFRCVSTGTRATIVGNIVANLVTTSGVEGITASDGTADDFRIIGNQFLGLMNRGINYAGDNGIISGNYFSATTDAAIRLSGVDCVTSDNVIVACGGTGSIHASGARQAVSGNVIRSATGHGIYFASGGDDSVITGNIVTNSATTKDGIRLDNVTECVVVGNKCEGTTQEHGLHTTGTADYIAYSGNVMRGNATGAFSIVGANNQSTGANIV